MPPPLAARDAQVIMLRLFKSFQAQPRLAIVTETIKTAIPELAHFFIVALCMFGCLFVNSIVFFGQDLEAFSTIPRAFHWCLAAVLGHFDWRSLKEVGYVNAASWLWIFSIVMSLISLNMLLAIVLDSYSLEKEKASELKTLLEQLGEVVRRRQERRRGQRVNLQEIWNAFLAEFNYDVKSMMVNRTLITPDSLMNAVPQIPAQQALRTLAHALQRQERLEIGHLTEEELKRELHKNLEDMQEKVTDVCRDVEQVVEKLDYFERLQAPGDATYDFYFSHEHASQDKASKAWISKMVSELSSDLKHTFHHGLRRYHVWQDHIEKQQTDLHESITDMQNLVQQHTGLLQGMVSAVDSLLEHDGVGQDGLGLAETAVSSAAS
ncbi:pkd-2 [Symbiodinium sp. CCMP2592]|nr:pkd-2 [Symbiodinium sp. CCMP2592]